MMLRSAGFLALQSQLLKLHADILAELRRRGLVRTNNAPIGDLAEHAAILTYDGRLANNSEKSYDLIAANQRRIQVKVRLVKASASGSLPFSMFRSFEFDAAVFITVDADTSSVREGPHKRTRCDNRSNSDGEHRRYPEVARSLGLDARLCRHIASSESE